MKKLVVSTTLLLAAVMAACSGPAETAVVEEPAPKEEAVTHPNADVARAAYKAFNSKDVPTVMGMLADNVVFEIPGRSVQSGTFSGKSEVGRYFSIIGKFTAGTHTVEPFEVLANDDRYIALLRGRGEHEGKVFDMTVIHVVEFTDGKVSKVSIIPTDQYAFDAFWS